jgi:carbonic anhydrase
MTAIAALLARNERFAADYTSARLGPPASGMVIVTCLDHRVDPAITLGLALGEAPVIRNAGGRVTPAVIEDLAFLAHLAGQLFGRDAEDGLFEVALIHHTQCATGLLADPDFRHRTAVATGLDESALEAGAVTDPLQSVLADVVGLLGSALLPPRVSVSGHVYDIATGQLSTAVDARHRRF